jgi:putative PIN family toxin of toxin-antitoxin system
MKTVIDTNVALDLLVFDDPTSVALKAALSNGRIQWLATPAMRSELERVLAYPQIAPRVAYYRLTALAVMAQFDALATLHSAAPRASAVCKDADDQIFIDLAVAHQALLLSKDKAVLCMNKRLQKLGARVSRAFLPEPALSPSA